MVIFPRLIDNCYFKFGLIFKPESTIFYKLIVPRIIKVWVIFVPKTLR